MNIRTLIRWVFREIRNNLRLSLFFVFNLSIGLVGFLCLDAFKTSLDQSLQENAKSFLSADLAVSARRMLKDSEIAAVQDLLPAGTVSGRTWEMFSMVASKGGSRLVQIKAIDDTYPFYGKLVLNSDFNVISGKPKDLQAEPVLWAYPELLSQLQAQVNDEIKLGDQSYRIKAVVTEDGSQTFRLASLAPKIFLGLNQIAKANLIKPGTTMTDTLLYQIPANIDSAALVSKIKLRIKDSGVEIQNYQAAAQGSGRSLQYLSDYLGLVSLVALFLAALGSGYLFRSYLFSRLYEVAILNSLGLQKRQAQILYMTQLCVLGLAAAVISLLGAWALLPLLTQALQSLSPISIPVILPLKTIFLSFVMAILGSLLVGLPFLRPLLRIQTSQLLQERTQNHSAPPFFRKDLLLFLPGLIFYWGLSIWQSKSFAVGGKFILIFFAALLGLWVLAWCLLRFLDWLPIKARWTTRHAFLSLSRRRGSSISVIVALGLGTLLMNVMPQLKVSLRQEMSSVRAFKQPSLFLFDIQPEQLDPLTQFLQKNNLSLQQVSPLVRARIIKVNDQIYERSGEQEFATREEEQEARFRNRGVNLSYRSGLSPSETLKEGRVFSGEYKPGSGGLSELSVEIRYAEQVGLKLGDRMTFDVQGIEIQGQIVNLRAVKWNSFQPNFFIQFQPGVLDEAPKTFLASISDLPKSRTTELQNQLVKEFPNVSIVDVSRVIQRILEISDRMSWSLELMAALSLIAGFVVLFSIANYEVRKRSWDLNLLKIFGASQKELFQYLAMEFGLLSFLAAFFGILISLIVSYGMSVLFFQGTYQFDLLWPLISLVAVTGLAVGIVIFVSYRIVQGKPAELLQGG